MSRSSPHPTVTPQPNLTHPERADVYAPVPPSPVLHTPTKTAALSPSQIPRPVSATPSTGYNKKIGRRLNVQLRKGKSPSNKIGRLGIDTRLSYCNKNAFIFIYFYLFFCFFLL